NPTADTSQFVSQFLPNRRCAKLPIFRQNPAIEILNHKRGKVNYKAVLLQRASKFGVWSFHGFALQKSIVFRLNFLCLNSIKPISTNHPHSNKFRQQHQKYDWYIGRLLSVFRQSERAVQWHLICLLNGSNLVQCASFPKDLKFFPE